MAKDTYYFSHDYNVRTDDKIKSLLMDMGMEGYGIFWCIVEDLYNNANSMLLHYKRIAYDLHCDEEKVEKVITGFDLFVINGEKFSSNSVKKRIREKERKSKQARDKAVKRWDAVALQRQSKGNALKESKVKEIKGKEIKESKGFNPPSADDVVSYFREKGYKEDVARKAHEYYDTAGWKDSEGKPVKNWKQKMISVWMKDEHKIPVHGERGIDRSRHPNWPEQYPYNDTNIYYFDNGRIDKMSTNSEKKTA